MNPGAMRATSSGNSNYPDPIGQLLRLLTDRVAKLIYGSRLYILLGVAAWILIRRQLEKTVRKVALSRKVLQKWHFILFFIEYRKQSFVYFNKTL